MLIAYRNIETSLLEELNLEMDQAFTLGESWRT